MTGYDFEKRWGIQLTDDQLFRDFRARIRNSLEHLDMGSLAEDENYRRIFNDMMARNYQYKDFSGQIGYQNYSFDATFYPKLLASSATLASVAKLIVSIINACLMSDNAASQSKAASFYRDVKRIFEVHGFRPFIFEIVGEVGQKVAVASPNFSDVVIASTVEKTMGALDNFPDVKYLMLKSIKDLLEKNDKRNALDDARLAVEKFIKAKYGVNKNFSNSIADVGRDLNSKKFNEELVKLFRWFDYYQNENVKHDYSKMPFQEAEFIIFMACSLINLIA